MAVKRVQGASRVLSVLEAVADNQPVGVASLARAMGEDKSAVQRSLMTLHDDGWIRQAPGEPTRWELTPRIHMVANAARGHTELRSRARGALEELRTISGESIILAVPDGQRLVGIDVFEGRHVIRTAPYIGIIISIDDTAAGKAALAWSDHSAREALLGAPVPPALAAELDVIRRRGWALNEGLVVAGATSIASAIRGADGRVVAAVIVSGPSTRLTADTHQRLGELVAATAAQLSLSRM